MFLIINLKGIKMIEFAGKKYLAEKEAANIIGLSISWLRLMRSKKESPHYIRFTKRGKIFYEQETLNLWIKQRMINY